MKDTTYFGKVTNGMIRVSNQRFFAADLEGKEIEIRKRRIRRSLSQNAYYWAVPVKMIRQELYEGEAATIFSNEQVHDLLKFMFLKEDVHIGDGVFVTRIKSTAEMTKTEFMSYLLQIQQWAASTLSLVIPDPGEQTELEYTPDRNDLDGVAQQSVY